MASSVRRRPNCFNLVFQLEFLMRCGHNQEASLKTLEAGARMKNMRRTPIPNVPMQCSMLHSKLPHQAQESAATFATAYALGKHEAAATMNLMRRIPSDIKEGLTSLVRQGQLEPGIL